MRPHEIENWARRAIARLEAGGQKEDDLVELKAKWPEPRWCARQLAGHANSARGSAILWIIGVDQVRGVCGTEHQEVGDWYNQVCAEFDGGVAPTLLGSAPFEKDGLFITPLALSTDRPPYVVRDPHRGSKRAGPFSLDVPWREGTNTRSAGRGELLLLLTERASLPYVEVLDGSLFAERKTVPAQDRLQESKRNRWYLSVALYLTSPPGSVLVFPVHRVRASCRVPSSCDQFTFEQISFWTPGQNAVTIQVTADEFCLSGSGKVVMKGLHSEDVAREALAMPLLIDVAIYAAGHHIPVSLALLAEPRAPRDPGPDTLGEWRLDDLSKDR